MSDNDAESSQDNYRVELGERLALALTRAKNKGDAALAAGISGEQLNKWVRGDVKVPAEGLRALAAYTRVDFSWLVTGDGEMLPTAHLGGLQQLRDAASRPSGKRALKTTLSLVSDMVLLPVYDDVRASAGKGAVPFSSDAEGLVAFARTFLRDQGAVPDHCSVIRASGDSMQPSIPDGSLLIVDHSQSEVRNGYIMVINLGDDLLVKRVRRRLDGLVDLISDNPAYPPETIGTAALQQLRVIGRVVYFCRTP